MLKVESSAVKKSKRYAQAIGPQMNTRPQRFNPGDIHLELHPTRFKVVGRQHINAETQRY